MFTRGVQLLAIVAALLAPPTAPAAAPPSPGSADLAAQIDHLLADHWRSRKLTPVPPADEITLLRRVTLDLTGRIPTPSSLDAFTAARSPERYTIAVRKLMRGPEFPAHFATVLDELIQGRDAGNNAFVGYLRRSLAERKGWDVVFREIMVGPWKDEARKPARLYLERRARDLDLLTTDTTRAFFGVDVSCARCHNHPLVKDWKREHYYGMTAFLVRTTGGKGNVGEKNDGEAKYAGKDGKERIVAMMFLSGQTLRDEPKASRRAALVRVALEEKRFFSRAFVNRVWENLLGRGLVDPPDQMHSGNRPSIPALLDHLATDFAANGYDIPRLVEAVVLSRAYRLASRSSSEPAPGHFAVARLRPLSPRQMARSLLVALGDGTFTPSAEKLAALDKESAELTASLDPRTRDFQSSTREALFVSNSEAVRKRITADDNLASRLSKLRDEGEVVRAAYRAILSRAPTDDELSFAGRWLKRQADRREGCEDLVWVLAASAEFRFNH